MEGKTEGGQGAAKAGLGAELSRSPGDKGMIALLAAALVLGPRSATLDPSVTLAAVGDVMLGRYVGRRIEREGWSFLFEKVKEELYKADFAFGNLECPLTMRPFAASKRFKLRGDPLAANALGKAGFDVMSVANNHALDCGPAGLSDTVQALGKAGVEAVGASEGPLLLTANDITVAFLAFTDAGSESELRSSRALNFEADIRRARKKSDIVVVSWHWGVEGSPKPSSRQTELVKRAAEAGADLILGHGPHVLQPVQWLARTDGRRSLVAYSLGNFVFDSVKEEERKTMILHVRLTAKGAISWRASKWRIEGGAPSKAADSKPLKSTEVHRNRLGVLR